MPRRKPSIESENEAKKGGVFAVIIVVVLIAGVIWAMTSGGAPPSSDANNLLAQASLAASAITKESFTFEGSVEASSDAGYFGIPVSGEGRIDIENKRSYMKINLESAVSPDASAMTLETYAIDNVVYTNFADTWGMYDAGERLWGEAQFSQKLIDLVDEFDADITEKEVVNGKSSFKVVINPSMEDVIELVTTMDPGILDRSGISAVPTIDQGVKKIEFIIWIDEFEFLPVKAEMFLEAETPIVNPGGSGVIDSNLIVSVTTNFDYKTPFNIVLPSAAQDAVEL